MQIEWIFRLCLLLTCDSLMFQVSSKSYQNANDERGENSSSTGILILPLARMPVIRISILRSDETLFQFLFFFVQAHNFGEFSGI